MKAEIIAVGSELLTPDRLDTNSLFLTEELNKPRYRGVRKSMWGTIAIRCGQRFTKRWSASNWSSLRAVWGRPKDDLTP